MDDDAERWVTFKAACRIVQQAHGWRMADDEAGRWVTDRFVAGAVSPHPSNVPVLEEILGERDDPGVSPLHHLAHVHKARWSLEDINTALAAEAKAKAKSAKRRPGRPPKWDWSAIREEFLCKYPRGGEWDIHAIGKELDAIAKEKTGIAPGDGTAIPYATKIQEEWKARGGN